MSGLLKRGNDFRTTHRLPGSYEPQELIDPNGHGAAGDQDEILAEIDKIAAENKIKVGDDTFRISAQKRGFLLPVLVNLFGLLFAVGGVWGLYFFFTEQERALVSEPSAVQAAENALIEALRERSEEELAAKEAEIGSIQDRLRQIDAERASLEANLESELEAREAALRDQLSAELDAERRRLEAQGASASDIEAQLQDFQSQRQAQFQEELAALEAEAEEERRLLEENLARLEGEFQNELSALEAERSALADELSLREAELRAELGDELSRQEEALTDAQRRLSNLAEVQEREQQVSAQIVGFYGAIRDDIRAGDYGGALEGLDTLEGYLNDSTLQEIPFIRSRQATERFVIGSLRDFVEQRRARLSSSGSVLEAARQLQQVTELVEEGNRQSAEGDATAAEDSYAEALSVIPEVAEGHEYIISRRVAEERALSDGAKAALTQARNHAAARRYREALDSYQSAVSFLPTDDPAVGAMVGEIRRLSVLLENQSVTNQQTATSQDLLARGEDALLQERNGDAIDAFLTLLEEYPRSEYTDEAVDGIQEAITAQRNRLLLAVAEAERREAKAIAEGEERESQAVAAQERAASELSEEIAALQESLDAVEEENDALRRDLEEAKAAAVAASATATVEATATTPNVPAPATSTVDAASSPESQQPSSPREETAGVAGAVARLDRLRNAYREYRQREAETLRENEQAGRIAARLYLDDFLEEEAVQEILPGLGETIRDYDQAFEVAGRRNALLEATDLVFALSSLTDPESRARYLSRELERTDDRQLKSFIEELLQLVEG